MPSRGPCYLHSDIMIEIRELRSEIKSLLYGQMRNRMILVALSAGSAFGGTLIGQTLNKPEPKEVAYAIDDIGIMGQFRECNMGKPDGGKGQDAGESY